MDQMEVKLNIPKLTMLLKLHKKEKNFKEREMS